MAVGPVSRLPFTPLPNSRSLVPVSAVRAPTRASKADREAAKRVRKLSDRRVGQRRRRNDEANAPKRRPGTPMTDSFAREVAVPRTPETGRRGWSAPGTAPFVTQVLAQEVLKSGLHIEPWRQAIDAYERAAGAAAPRVRPPMPSRPCRERQCPGCPRPSPGRKPRKAEPLAPPAISHTFGLPTAPSGRTNQRSRTRDSRIRPAPSAFRPSTR